MTETRSLATSHKDCTVDISYKMYAEITKGFMKFIMDRVIDGEAVDLPARMGTLLVAGKKVVPRFDEYGNIINLAPDWLETKKLWDSNPQAKEKKTLIYHFNEHTAGIRYKITWNRGMTGALNKILYTFRASRENKRRTWRSIESGREYYVKPKYNNNGNS